MNAFQYAKLLESITLYGFLDPILARVCVLHGDLEIVGGYHRWLGAGDLQIDTLPFVVKDMDDQTAKKISLIDNELHGQADPVGLRDLLKELLDDNDLEESLKALPFTDDILKSLTGLPILPPAPSSSPGASPPERSAGLESWVERTYRMPSDVAEVLDDALAKAVEREKQATGTDIQTFTALEILAAEFLAS